MPAAISIFLAAILALTGCCRLNPGDRSHTTNPPTPLSASKDALPNFRTPARIAILNSPRQLQTDVVYPPLISQQALVWTEAGLNWKIRFPPRRYAYAGIVLRKPINLAEHKDRMNLVLRIQPATMARHLVIALVDKPESAPPAYSDVALADFVSGGAADQQLIKIPLSAFTAGEVLDLDPADHELGAETHVHESRALDWTRIGEIRIVSPGGNIPAKQISIQDLLLQRK